MMRPTTFLLTALALGFTSTSPVFAELRVSGVWGGIFTGTGTSSMTIEFDTETHRVDVFGTYRNLGSELTDFVLEHADGSRIVMLIEHDGGLAGSVHGSMTLDQADADAMEAGDLQLRMINVDPNQSGGFRAVHFDDTIHQAAHELHPTIPGAITTSYGFTTGPGLHLAVSTQGYVEDVARVEFFHGAWIGETGTSVGEPVRFAGGEWWTLNLDTLSEELRRDYRNGMTYVEIETNSVPPLLTRLQLTDHQVGTQFCQFNSLDEDLLFSGSNLSISGSPRLGDGELTLNGRWLPANTFVIPLVSRSNRHRAMVPFTSSVMCLGGGPVGRLASGVGMTNASGVFEAVLDPLAIPTPNGPVAAIPGEQWNVQLWYRDVQDGGLVQSNFSSAVRFELR